ncbi:hypothetical protein WJX84_004417 [Apatococcus fuscideae]|uniref:EGF-like domain-containing protein n=1 Tax=Apatococcus fuscideae TaxID=2026836 RepID=A0AAW1SRK7_9CHLO
MKLRLLVTALALAGALAVSAESPSESFHRSSRIDSAGHLGRSLRQAAAPVGSSLSGSSSASSSSTSAASPPASVSSPSVNAASPAASQATAASAANVSTVIASPGSSNTTAGNPLCGSTEYYCGDSDIELDTLYTAVTTLTCQEDTDVGIWVCGDHVVASDTYHTIQGNKGTCLADCSMSSSPLALPSQYYYQVTDWSPCSDACDGGFQTRSITCHSSQDGGQVANNLCDQLDIPETRQACSAEPCIVTSPGLSLQFTPYGLCEADCGTGISARAAICANPYGVLADSSACTDYSGPSLIRTCTGPSCSSAYYHTSAWSACSPECDGGTSNRTVQCVSSSGQQVDPTNCRGQLVPPSSKECNPHPCVGYAWQVGAWGNCSLPCGAGIQNRTVQCVDQFGKNAPSSYCVSANQPPDELQCNLQPCNFCASTDCSGQGTCKNNVCSCQPGYRGYYCEISPQCPGILDTNGNCCQNGVVDQNGQCCSQGAITDRNAQCCTSGRLDACGECDGPAKAVDVVNRCCASGVLDAAGYCCESGQLDECGVCDGDDMSCSLHVIAIVTVAQASNFFTLGGPTFVTTFASFAAGILAVKADKVTVADYVLQPGQTGITSNSANVQLRVEFSVAPEDSFSVPEDLRASIATSNLQKATGKSAANQLFVLQNATMVERAAICGNLVCEAGERSTGTGEGCAGDCPFTLKTCPANTTNGVPCSQNGWCMSASGVCECYFGYAGSDCSQCAEGYMRAPGGNACSRYVKAALPQLDSTSGAAGTYAPIAILGALAFIFLVIAIGFIVAFVQERKKVKRYRRSRLRKMKTAKRGSLAAQLTGNGNNGDDEDPLDEPLNISSRHGSIMDVARSVASGMLTLRTKSVTTGSQARLRRLDTAESTMSEPALPTTAEPKLDTTSSLTKAAVASRLKVQHRPRAISSPAEAPDSGGEAGPEDSPDEGASYAGTKTRHHRHHHSSHRHHHRSRKDDSEKPLIGTHPSIAVSHDQTLTPAGSQEMLLGSVSPSSPGRGDSDAESNAGSETASMRPLLSHVNSRGESRLGKPLFRM